MAERQRLDKWLWFARVVKTRTLGAKLVSEGGVRINQVKADAASKSVKSGDVLTIALEREVRVLKVLAPGVSRRPYEEARLLYEDLTPPPLPKEITPAVSGLREPGSGRPTGRDRRVLDRLMAGDEE
jgi:ribosome-associated heat shock protein Hsp15